MSTSADDRARVQAHYLEVQAASRGLLTAAAQMRGSCSVAPSSQADREHQHAFVEPDGIQLGDPILGAHAAAELRIAAAAEHLDYLTILLASDSPPVWTGQSIARVTGEYSARSWYLLDPNLDARGRAARYLTDELHALREVEKSGDAMSDGRQPDERRGEILLWAAANGFTDIDTNAKPARVGPPRPGSTDVCNMLLAETGEKGFRWYSASVHGTITALHDVLDVPDGSEDIADATIVHRPTTGTAAVMWASMAYMTAAHRHVELFGWPVEEWTRAKLTSVSELSRLADAAEDLPLIGWGL